MLPTNPDGDDNENVLKMCPPRVTESLLAVQQNDTPRQTISGLFLTQGHDSDPVAPVLQVDRVVVFLVDEARVFAHL